MLTPPKPPPSNFHFKLVKGGFVYAPEPLGRQDILIHDERIIAIGSEDFAAKARALGRVDVIDVKGRSVVPGFIDQHIHFLGGGDTAGPAARVPELHASWMTRGGVTTAVGLLGQEAEMKGLHGLLVKARELELAGLSTYVITGSLDLPSPTLTKSPLTDVTLIDKVIGAKVGLAEDKFPNLAMDALARLAGQMILAGEISRKAAILHCHVGGHPRRLDQLFELLDKVHIPIRQVVPTHINRARPDTLEHAIRFAGMGGTIDITAVMTSRIRRVHVYDPDVAVRTILDAGVPIERITMSSDSNVARPVYNHANEFLGHKAAAPAILHREWVEIVRTNRLPLEQALPIISSNVARVLKLDRKGALKPGMDADITVLDDDLSVSTVLCRGRTMVLDGEVVVKGPQEEFDPSDVGF